MEAGGVSNDTKHGLPKRTNRCLCLSKYSGYRRGISLHPNSRTPRASRTGGADSHGVLPPEFRGGKLNPRWEEWLMGVPIGWLALEPLETESYRQWWQSFCD